MYYTNHTFDMGALEAVQVKKWIKTHLKSVVEL